MMMMMMTGRFLMLSVEEPSKTKRSIVLGQNEKGLTYHEVRD